MTNGKKGGANMKFYFNGLQVALKRFETDGEFAKCGNWSIASGGYDLWWEIYYKGYTVLQCIDGELIGGFRPFNEFDTIKENKLIEKVKEIYTYVK